MSIGSPGDERELLLSQINDDEVIVKKDTSFKMGQEVSLVIYNKQGKFLSYIIAEINRIYVSGSYVVARMREGKRPRRFHRAQIRNV